MKKRVILLISVVTAIVVTLVCMLINYTYYENKDKLLLGIEISGGEMNVEGGFGVCVKHLYPEARVDEPVKSTSKIYFSPLCFAGSVVLITIILFSVGLIIRKINKRRLVQ